MVLIFKKWPLLNTMTTYAILWTISDINEQKFISKKPKVDTAKTARMATVGSTVIAPIVFIWLRVIERFFPGTHIRVVLKKVVSEQILCAPVAATSFYTATCLLEGKNIQAELEAKFVKTYMSGLMFWPLVQIVNHSFIPVTHKPVLVAGASFLWSTFLCFMKEESKQEKIQSISS